MSAAQESGRTGDDEGWADGDVEGRDGRGGSLRGKTRPSPSGQHLS